MPRSSWRRRTPAKLDDAALDLLDRHAARETDRDRGDAVGDVVAADEQRLEALDRSSSPSVEDVERDAAALADLEVARPPGHAPAGGVAVRRRVVDDGVRLDPARGELRDRDRLGRLGADDEQAVGGHQRDELPERVLDRLERREDVDVIELDRREDRGVRAVVEELRALVEERGVVLVALDDEVLALAELLALAERDRHAADEQRRIAAGLLEDVRDAATWSWSCRGCR